MGGFDITKVTPQQLQELAKAIEAELQQLATSYNQLMLGSRKFKESKEVLVYLKEQGQGKEVMVPMTSSLYVPGVMEDTENVLVEVGANYFIEQHTEKAQDYCTRKQSLLGGNAKKVQEIMQVKKVQLQKVQGEFEKRVNAQMFAQMQD